ncbi:MAG: efflux transporter outer membrane subunit [Nitrospinota bacterium]
MVLPRETEIQNQKNKRSRGSLFLALILFFSGCSGSAPSRIQTEPEIKLPKTWAGSSAYSSAPLPSWLDDFNDPLLKATVKKALGKNFDIKAAVARREAARSTFRISSSALLPTLGVSGDQSRTLSDPGKTNTRSERTTLSFDLSWEPDLWKRISLSSRAEFEIFLASETDLEALKLSLSINIARFWFDTVEKKMQIRLAERRLENFQKNLNIINKGYEKGVYSELDIRFARSDIAVAQNRVEQEKEVFDRTLRALQVLLGSYPNLLLEIPETLVTPDASIPAGLPSDLLTRRPDLIRAEHLLAASDWKRQATKKNWLPQIQLTGTAGLTSTSLSKILDPEALFFSILGRASQPLFNGGRLKEERKRAGFQVDEKLAAYTQAALTAFKEVETALARTAYLNRQAELLRKSQLEAKRAEELALERYLAGLNDVLVYLDAQQRTYDSERALLNLKNQKIQNRLDLYLALGGGFKRKKTK